MNDPLHCYILYDPRFASSFFVGRTSVPLDEIMFHHMHYPHEYPPFVERLIGEIYLSGYDPVLYEIPQKHYKKAASALERKLRQENRAASEDGVRGRPVKDPLEICNLAPRRNREHIARSPPLTEKEAYSILVMRHVDGLYPAEIRKRTGIKKAALNHLLSGKRHHRAWKRFHEVNGGAR